MAKIQHFGQSGIILMMSSTTANYLPPRYFRAHMTVEDCLPRSHGSHCMVQPRTHVISSPRYHNMTERSKFITGVWTRKVEVVLVESRCIVTTVAVRTGVYSIPRPARDPRTFCSLHCSVAQFWFCKDSHLYFHEAWGIFQIPPGIVVFR